MSEEKKNRFDLEDHIHQVWSTTEDMIVVGRKLKGDEKVHLDLLRQLFEIRMSALWEVFEKMIMDGIMDENEPESDDSDRWKKKYAELLAQGAFDDKPDFDESEEEAFNNHKDGENPEYWDSNFPELDENEPSFDYRKSTEHST